MKKIWLVVSLFGVFFGRSATAQYVTIPDYGFINYLKTYEGCTPCFNGLNQLDTTCPAVLAVTSMNVAIGTSNNIYNIEGVQYFDNLVSLTCDGNASYMDSLPSRLSPALQTLHATNMSMSALPPLPPSIIDLDCSFNPLYALPNLPPALQKLRCAGNGLSSLPSLPNALLELDVSSNPVALANYLSTLALPPALVKLTCNSAHVHTLPALPGTLTYLSCSYNNSWPALSSLPTLPTALKELYCNNNFLTTLPALPTGLTHLDCNTNQLSVLPNLSDSLVELICNNNQLTGMPSLPSNLSNLQCQYNQLAAIPAFPTHLVELNCSNNQLNSIPAIPSGLKKLRCANNTISYLPALPDTLFECLVNNNPSLQCIPPLETFYGPYYFFSLSGTQITCLPNVIQHMNSIPAIDTMPVCGIFGNGCEVAWNISGNVYRDDNLNCTADNDEPRVQNVKMNLTQGGALVQQVYSNGAGNFSFNTGLGSFETSIDTTGLPLLVSCPAANTLPSTLTSADSLDYTINFALKCKPGYDLGVQSIVTTAGWFFPGQQARINIASGDMLSYYYNYLPAGCNIASLPGTVSVTMTGPVTVDSVSANGTVNGSTITWNVSDFSAFDFSHSLWIQFTTNTTAQANDVVCLDVDIAGATGSDYNPSNNSLTQCFHVVNSFDPNFKEVYPATVTTPGDWHSYTVHFQNTGTAPAQHVQVIDTLDANLDWSSFQLLSYSHDNLTQVLQNGIVHFNFPNINLPDSTSDEPNSHGWIQYRIKTKADITAGTTIHNTASIYFDFNTPVVTNDAVVNFCVPQTVSQTLPICQGDSVQVGSSWYHQAGTYTNAFITVTGCDSVVITNLSVLQPSSSQQSYSICQGDSVQVNGVWHSQAGTFTSTFPNAGGCDSTVSTTVALLTPTAYDQTVLVCPGTTVAVGTSVYATAGAYTDILQNAAGCDSVVTTLVEWYPVGAVDVTASQATLTAEAAASYQWFGCADSLPIPNATAQSYTATQTGLYWVETIDANGCTATSSCVSVTVTGLATVSPNRFSLYPNPAQNAVIVSTVGTNDGMQLQLTDLTGKILLTRVLDKTITQFPLDNLAAGSYLARLVQNGRTVGVKNLTVIK